MSKFTKSYKQAITPEHREKLLKHGIRAVLNEDLKEEWKHILEDKYNISKEIVETQSKVRKINYYKILALAASFALIAFFGRTFFNTPVDSIQLAQTYLESESIQHPGLTKGIAYDEQEIRHAAIQSFDAKNYEESIGHFTQLNTKNSEDEFYLSIAYLYANQYDKSINILTNLTSSNSLYKQEVNWYLSIAYLLNEEPSFAKATLLKIGSNDWNYSKAQSLLKAINK